MSVHKARDGSAERKAAIKAEGMGVENDGKLTYSRLQGWEGFWYLSEK